MAPKRNQAKPKRGSFLTRGREQVRQRQQTRQQASRQLPPQGGTTANSPKATGQRVATAVGQKVRRDVATTRALADMMQRNVDRTSRAEGIRNESRMASGKTRYVPPGGENAKGQGALPPGQRGGDMRQKGGPLATRGKGGPITQRGGGMTRTNNGGPVSEVKVQDMGNSQPRQLPGQRGLPGGTGGADRVTASGARTGQPGPNRNALPGGQRALPPSQPSARRQAAQAKADSAARGSQGPNRVGQPAGSANRVYGANVVNGAVDRAMRQQRGTRANVAGAVVSALAQPLVDRAAARGGRNLAKALTPIGRAIDNTLPGNNSKDEAKRKAPAKPTRSERQGPTVPARILAAGGGGSNRAASTTRCGSGSGSPARSTSGGGSGGGSRGPSTQSGGGSTQSRSASPSRSSSAPSAPFKGTVDEGRMIWAQKYSSDKYKGQAIQKEAQALLEKLKVKKGDGQSAASKAGWDGNKNY